MLVGQAQKELFVNEALARLDLYVQPTVVGEASFPPVSPEPGQTWLVAAGATGAWEGADGCLVGWSGNAWHFCPPWPGMTVWDDSTHQQLRHDGVWQRPARPAAPVGGAVIDTEARVALGSVIAALEQAGILPRV